MQQEKIWDYLQNEGLTEWSFPEARQRFMLRHVEAGQRVINIGVGAGTLEKLALEKGVEIHALDPSQRAIERLRESLGLGERAQAGFAQDMPFASDWFDVVVMSEVLEHLDDDMLQASLREVLRVLKPGGRLLASTPYREDLRTNGVVCPDCGKVFHKFGHVQSFDKPGMQNLLTSAGFDIEKIWVTTFIDWRRRGVRNLFKSIIRWTLACMGERIADPHLVVIARKI